MILFQFFSSVVSHSFKINWLLSTEKFPRGEWLQKKKIHLVPPIITPLLVIPLPKSSSADLDEPIPFLLVQFSFRLAHWPRPPSLACASSECGCVFFGEAVLRVAVHYVA